MKLTIMFLAAATVFVTPALAAVAPHSVHDVRAVSPADLTPGALNFRAPVIPYWAENFDGLLLGGLIGQGGWQGWDGNPASDAVVTDTHWQSAPHSVEILTTSDVVQTFTDAASGRWIASGWSFVPASAVGQQFFILLNTYQPGGPYNWSLQVLLDSDNGVVQDFDGTATLPLIRDQWVELRAEINLAADTQAVYYNNQLLFSDTWTTHVPQTDPGVLAIAALDLYSNGGTPIYWDDLVLGDPFGCVVVQPGQPGPGLHMWSCDYLTAVEDPVSGAQSLSVAASPNPFTRSTTISFHLPGREEVRVEVYDLRGSLVKTLLSGMLEPGPAGLTWDGRNESGQRVASGIYFMKLSYGTIARTAKIVVLQ